MPIGGSANCSKRVVAEDRDDTVVAVVEVAPERNDRKQQEGRDERQERGQDEDPFLGLLRHEVFLEEELDAVGQCLQDPPRAGQVRPDPVLEVADHLALEPDHQHGRHEQQHEDQDDLEDHDEHGRQVDIEQKRIDGEHHAVLPLDAHIGEAGGGVDQLGDGNARLVEAHGRTTARHARIDLEVEGECRLR